MSRDLQGAMNEEKLYTVDRLKNINTSLIERLAKYGYNNLMEYFDEKKDYMLSNWSPKVYYVDEDFFNNQLEQNIINGIDGIYIMSPKNKYYAYHGDDDIDYDECKSLGVTPVELHYHGGTIIGGEEDLGILIVIPQDIMLSSADIGQKIMELVKADCPMAIMEGNDILIDGDKVMGSMTRHVGKYLVWAAQFSFAEHDELIGKICKKKQKKKPSTFKLLKREKLEKEVLKWLRKQ